MEIIFKALCGLLYCIGYPFGLSYVDSSVIICIYLCPIICMLMALYASYHTFKSEGIWCRILFSINLSLLLLYMGISNMFWKHYYVYDPFTLCMNDIKAISNRMNITYEETNLLIYCVLFFGIILFHLISAKLGKKSYEKSISPPHSDARH